MRLKIFFYQFSTFSILFITLEKLSTCAQGLCAQGYYLPTDNGMKLLSGFGCTFRCSTMARIGFVVFNENVDGLTFHWRFFTTPSPNGECTTSCFSSSRWISLKFSLLCSIACSAIIVTQRQLIFSFPPWTILKEFKTPWFTIYLLLK